MEIYAVTELSVGGATMSHFTGKPLKTKMPIAPKLPSISKMNKTMKELKKQKGTTKK